MAWLVAVAVGGGLTLWLRESAEPPEPRSWERVEPSESPAPLLEGTACPQTVLCAYATTR